jgi:hypothetical protein
MYETARATADTARLPETRDGSETRPGAGAEALTDTAEGMTLTGGVTGTETIDATRGDRAAQRGPRGVDRVRTSHEEKTQVKNRGQVPAAHHREHPRGTQEAFPRQTRPRPRREYSRFREPTHQRSEADQGNQVRPDPSSTREVQEHIQTWRNYEEGWRGSK